MKKITVGLSTIVSKQTGTTKNPGCCKQKQNKVVPYGDLVDQAFSQFNEDLINNNVHISFSQWRDR